MDTYQFDEALKQITAAANRKWLQVPIGALLGTGLVLAICYVFGLTEKAPWFLLCIPVAVLIAKWLGSKPYRLTDAQLGMLRDIGLLETRYGPDLKQMLKERGYLALRTLERVKYLIADEREIMRKLSQPGAKSWFGGNT
jgi:hypothetical protein